MMLLVKSEADASCRNKLRVIKTKLNRNQNQVSCRCKKQWMLKLQNKLLEIKLN
jgi:hypothetical protein